MASEKGSQSQSRTGVTYSASVSTSLSDRNVSAMLRRIYEGMILIIPTALFGGLSTLGVCYSTGDVTFNEPGVIIADRFVNGSFLYLVSKFCVHSLVPTVTGFRPSSATGAGICGGLQGYYYGSYGPQPHPLGCCLVLATVAVMCSSLGGAA